MATEKLDTIRGTAATLTSAGWVINQTANLDGLIPESSQYGIVGLISAAYTVLLNNGYYIGKFLPISDGGWPIVLDEMNFSTFTPDNQEVTLVWRSRRMGNICANFTTGMASEQTNVNSNGSPLKVKYTYPEGHEKAGETETTGAMTTKLIPEMTVDIQRTEWGPTYGYAPGYDISQIILYRKSLYEGKVNLNPYNPVPTVTWVKSGSAWYNLQQAPPIPTNNQACWLCMGINAQTNDSGLTYDVSYTFAYRPPYTADVGEFGGWVPRVVFIDPTTGRPPSDAAGDETYGEGSILYPGIYEEVDFTGIWNP
jgi:hypothetical protein